MHELPARAVRSRDDPALVVVDAQEVDRRSDQLEVPVPHRRLVRGEALEHVRGIRAAEDRVEEPAVAVAVEGARRLDVLGSIAGGLCGLEVDRDSDLGAGRLAAQDLRGETVREQDVVGGGDRVRRRGPAGCVDAVAVAEPGDHPRLVQRDPVPDAISEPGGDRLDVPAEGLGRGAHRPPARILERRRQVPVVQRHDRLDLVREQLVDDSVVEVEPGVVHAPVALGQHPRPRDREPERVDAEVVREGDVVAVAVVEVARQRAALAVADVARLLAEAVPDAEPAPVGLGRALDLVRGRGCAPEERLREPRAFVGGGRHGYLTDQAKHTVRRSASDCVDDRKL